MLLLIYPHFICVDSSIIRTKSCINISTLESTITNSRYNSNFVNTLIEGTKQVIMMNISMN